MPRKEALQRAGTGGGEAPRGQERRGKESTGCACQAPLSWSTCTNTRSKVTTALRARGLCLRYSRVKMFSPAGLRATTTPVYTQSGAFVGFHLTRVPTGKSSIDGSSQGVG